MKLIISTPGNLRINKERIVDVIAFLFILLFMYTAASKLFRIEYFGAVIRETPLLEPFAAYIQWAVPVSEILVSVMLATGRFRLAGLYGSFALMVIFIAYIAGILNFSKLLPCACGGVIEELGWRGHLLFNTAFAALALLGILLERQRNKKRLIPGKTPRY